MAIFWFFARCWFPTKRQPILSFLDDLPSQTVVKNIRRICLQDSVITFWKEHRSLVKTAIEMTRLREVEPTKTSSLKLYSSSTIECLERLEEGDEVSTRISGKSSRCGKYSWLVRGSALEVYWCVLNGN